MEKFDKFQSRYESGTVPWDHALPPPELIALAEQLQPGHVLDLGCGYGRSCIYLAQRGWQAVGVDFVPLAIEEAKHRAEKAAVSERIEFRQSAVTDLPFGDAQFDLIVDIGCMHALSDTELKLYTAHVKRLLKKDGRYLLFAHIRQEDKPHEELKGVLETTIRQQFADLRLDNIEHGMTQVEDKPAWQSAWFWYRKT